LNPKEQGLPDSACVVYRVVTASGYPVSFESVWGPDASGITWPSNIDVTCATEGATVALSGADRAVSNAAYDQIGLSIAAYEGSPEVNAFTSKFDARRAGMVNFTKKQARGSSLFRGKAMCDKCHTVTAGQTPFTDFTYENIGIPANPENPMYASDPGYVDLGLGGYLATRPEFAQFAAKNDGKFKVPTLRNVGLWPSPDTVKAYGHNGYFKSLGEIVHFYNTRDVLPACDAGHPTWVEGKDCWPASEYAKNVNHTIGDLGLTPRQEHAIVAFLKTLSDGYMKAG
jgi:cytochrome c peroxidase